MGTLRKRKRQKVYWLLLPNMCLECLQGVPLLLRWHRVCRFVSTSIECEPDIRKSRLAWCYGDLGVLWALYNSSGVLDDLELRTYALEAFVSAARIRRGLRSNYVNDACVCHGAAGLSAIFKSLYKRFQYEELLSAADYWAKVALNFCQSDGNGYKFLTFDPSVKGGYTESSGLLEGSSGVAMALLPKPTPLARWLLFE